MYKVWLVGIGVLLVLGAGAVQFFSPRQAVAPVLPTASTSPAAGESTGSSDTGSASVETPKAVGSGASTLSAPHPLPLVEGDTVASWTFKGAYADRPDLITKAEGEIARLSSLFGEGKYSDMTLYVGIANQYGLLGNGKQEYEYLGRAVKADAGVTSGLPWHNLGVLMERLGTLETARVAYEKATLIQPEMKFYHLAYFEFLTTRMKDGAADIEKEYAAAIQSLGQDPDILSLYAEWKKL